MGLVGEVLLALSELDDHLSISLMIFTVATALLLLWRLWRFTIEPMMKPTEPKELPYWLPCKHELYIYSLASSHY